MLCYVLLCLCFAMLCFVMLCFVMFCCVMFYVLLGLCLCLFCVHSNPLHVLVVFACFAFLLYPLFSCTVLVMIMFCLFRFKGLQTVISRLSNCDYERNKEFYSEHSPTFSKTVHMPTFSKILFICSCFVMFMFWCVYVCYNHHSVCLCLLRLCFVMFMICYV